MCGRPDLVDSFGQHEGHGGTGNTRVAMPGTQAGNTKLFRPVALRAPTTPLVTRVGKGAISRQRAEGRCLTNTLGEVFS